jgi:hypothetical protein
MSTAPPSREPAVVCDSDHDVRVERGHGDVRLDQGVRLPAGLGRDVLMVDLPDMQNRRREHPVVWRWRRERRPGD